jgi:hypothetical protein
VEFNMGATISLNKQIAGFVRANGDIVYIAFEETCSKRDHPRVPHWSAGAIGSYDDIMEYVFRGAVSAEGESLQTRGGHTTPEAYIQRWREAFKVPVRMQNISIRLSLGGGSTFSTIVDEDVEAAVGSLMKIGRGDLVDALKAGPVTLQLHDDADVIIALYGMRSKLGLWRVVRGDPPAGHCEDWLVPAKRQAPVIAPTTLAYKLDNESVLVSIGGAPYEHMGWVYSAVGEYVMSVVLPLELRCDGAAKKMIGAFREKLNAAPKLPGDSRIWVTPGAGGTKWNRENAESLAVKLGLAETREAVPDTYQISFDQVQDDQHHYLLRHMHTSQLRWELALDDHASVAPMPLASHQPYFEQESLF